MGGGGWVGLSNFFFKKDCEGNISFVQKILGHLLIKWLLDFKTIFHKIAFKI